MRIVDVGLGMAGGNNMVKDHVTYREEFVGAPLAEDSMSCYPMCRKNCKACCRKEVSKTYCLDKSQVLLNCDTHGVLGGHLQAQQMGCRGRCLTSKEGLVWPKGDELYVQG